MKAVMILGKRAVRRGRGSRRQSAGFSHTERSIPSLDSGVYSKSETVALERLHVHDRQTGFTHQRRQRHIAHYEQEGLVEPAGKSPGGYWLFDKDTVRRVRFVKQLSTPSNPVSRSRRSVNFLSCADARKRVAATFARERSRKSCRSRIGFAL